jgi:sterol desaturase/sphingolipid hydroxylase (fatty acid hydroxylase superfamily)
MSQFKFIIRYLYAPLFFIGFIGSSIYLVERGVDEAWLLMLLFAAIATSFLAERIVPFEKAWNLDKGDSRKDFLHALVNEISISVTVLLVPVLASFGVGFNLWPTSWPLWAQFGAAVIVLDFGITITHFASHRFEPLWRIHAVHHSVKRLYGFNGLMKHPVHQAIEIAAGTLPLLILGMPLEIAALLGFASAIQLMLQHSNVDMRVGPLIHLWAVAPGHRHHHLASKTEGDVNFGLFTMVWDHMLGTFMKDRPQPRDGELGVAGRPDFPVTYGAQLLDPFRNVDT